MLSKREKMLERLHKLYGPFVRFFPEGTEGKDDNDNDDAVDDAIKSAEDADKKEFNKERQRADQADANAQKAGNRATVAETELETVQGENESLKEQLAEAEAKATRAGIDVVDLKIDDFEGTDIPLVKAVLALQKAGKAKDAEIDALNKKAGDYETKQKTDDVNTARTQVYNKLLGDLDKEYGAEHRNTAVTEFNKLSADGKVPKGNPVEATRIMEQCYKNAVKAKPADKDKKGSPTLDTGSGGGRTPNLSGIELTKGSLDEVAAQAGAILSKT